MIITAYSFLVHQFLNPKLPSTFDSKKRQYKGKIYIVSTFKYLKVCNCELTKMGLIVWLFSLMNELKEHGKTSEGTKKNIIFVLSQHLMQFSFKIKLHFIAKI